MRVPIAWVQLGVLGSLLAVLPAGRRVDPDFWWHLRTGQLIVESGIPRHDVYSWTAHGNDWVAHEWLSEAIIYIVQSALGYIGNVLLFDVALFVSLGLMLRLAREQGAGTRVLVLLTALSVFMLGSFFSVRPQVFTWLLFSAFVYITMRHEAGGRVHLWLLPALMAVWVNLHLGFVYGLMILAIWLASLLIQRTLQGRQVQWRGPVLAAGASVLATFLNPRGPLLLLYPIDYLSAGRADRALVAEWQHPQLTDISTLPLLAGAAVLGAVMLTKQRPPLFGALLALATLLLAASAARNVPFVAIVHIAVSGPALARRWRAASRASDARTTMRLIPALAVILITAVFVWSASWKTTSGASFWQPSERGYPSEGAAFVREHYPGRKLYNEYHWGGYLEYKLYPDVPVFIDGRADFYGEQILRDFATIGRVEAGWDALLDEYGVEVVIMRRGYSLSGALRQDPAWQEVFLGDVERVFVRTALVR